MNDDIFKKIKSILSGSEESLSSQTQSIEKNNEDIVNGLVGQLLDAAWLEEELANMNSPTYTLSRKKSSYWFMNTQTKMLSHIKCGIELTPVEWGDKESVCMIGHSLYKVPNEFLLCTGWN